MSTKLRTNTQALTIHRWKNQCNSTQSFYTLSNWWYCACNCLFRFWNVL